MRRFFVMAHTAEARFCRLSLCVALVAVLLGACENSGGSAGEGARTPRPVPTETDSRVIGIVGTFSGPMAWRGEDAFEGADVSVGKLNRRLPEDVAPFELVSLDDEGDPDRATALVEELTRLPRIVGVVFAGPPEALVGAEDALAQAGIPAFLCYGDLYGARLLSPHVFQMSPSYLWEGRTLARYMAADREYRTVGVMAEDSPDGNTARAALRQETKRAGLSLRRSVVYDPSAESFRSELRSLRESQVEALVIHGSPGVVARIVEDLRSMGVRYTGTDQARVASAPRRVRVRRSASNYWRPQILALDLAISDETDQSMPAGMVASDTYARGVHYLPVPNFRRFEEAFEAWWAALPTGWELRAHDAVQAIGWAVAQAAEADDLALTLETLEGKRFGGLPVTFGPDDHTAVDETTVGLWTLPPETPDAPDTPRLEWVTLARGFTINGQRTTILPEDWRHLFRDPPPPSAPAPRFSRMAVGVTTSRNDPLQ
jgi:ABC-type branched-subunit amino acid transport system substrate-binding protein